jgi:hypothetical protein
MYMGLRSLRVNGLELIYIYNKNEKGIIGYGENQRK